MFLNNLLTVFILSQEFCWRVLVFEPVTKYNVFTSAVAARSFCWSCRGWTYRCDSALPCNGLTWIDLQSFWHLSSRALKSVLRALKSVLMNATAGCQIYSDVLLGEDVLFGPGSQTMAQESAEESARGSHGKRRPFCVVGKRAVVSSLGKTNISVGFFLPRENIKTMFEHRQAVLSCRMNQVPGQKRCRMETNLFLPKTIYSDNVFGLEGKWDANQTQKLKTKPLKCSLFRLFVGLFLRKHFL